MDSNINLGTQADQSQWRNRELSILNSIAQALNRSIHLREALDATLAQVADLFGLETGWVWLLDHSMPYLAATQNLPAGLIENPHLMEGSCYCLDTFQSGDLDGAANVNVITCSRLKKLVGGSSGLRYHASIPLYDHGQKLGVLNVASADWRELTAEDLRLLYTIGDLLGIAIERTRLFNQSAEFGAAEERNRLAREIHDTLAQGLTGITLLLETAEMLAESQADAERMTRTVHQALDLARANLDEARRSVLDLRAVPLEGKGLADALGELTHTISSREQVIVSFDIVGPMQALPGRLEVGLFRIAQEALSNVEQHSGAKHVAVRLTIQPEKVLLSIEDDGIGFDPAQTAPGHFGVIGLSERARLLGGQLNLETGVGEGTRVEINVPITGG